ncbi:MAG: sugar phosphate isomerase/epimerase [Cellvibrio sp.]|jgi:sugar phosphate isomerase/epimerase|nr:sugar phosphate isomerase/epimerase [Cellvibrio sp.]
MKPLFGLRAHDFGTKPADELALSIAASGATCIQLALAKALPGSHLLPSEFGEAGMFSIREAFASHGLKIAVLGCYIDTVTPDLTEREFSLARFEAHIDAAASLGCRVIGTETGSPIPYMHKPDGEATAFQVALESLFRLVKAAEERGVCVGVEPVAEFHALSSATHAKIMIEKFNSPALGIIFDPVNLVPSNGIADMTIFLDECFSAFGKHIVAIHAKDYQMIDGAQGLKKSGALPAGAGEMDWEGVFFRLINAGKSHVPILLEEAGPEQAGNAFEYLQKAWDNALNSIHKK